MSQQDRRDTPQPNIDRVPRRTFLRRGLGLAGAGVLAAAATAVEPLVRPFIDSRGVVNAEEGKPSKTELFHEPYWAIEKDDDEQRAAQKYVTAVLVNSKTKGHPEINRIIDEFFLPKNGPSAIREQTGDFFLRLILRLQSKTKPPRTKNSLFNYGIGISSDPNKLNQLDFNLYLDNAHVDQFPPDSIEAAVDLYINLSFIELAMETAKKSENIDSANAAIKAQQLNLDTAAAKRGTAVLLDLRRMASDKQTETLASDKATQAASEEVPPPEVAADDSSGKPTEPSDNASADVPDVEDKVVAP